MRTRLLRASIALGVVTSLVVAFAAPRPAVAAELDLAGVRGRVAAALDSLDPSSPLRGKYRRLETLLAKPDRPGLADEFAKLDAIAKECAAALSTDTALVAALRDALESARAALASAESEAAFAIADVPTARGRHTGDAKILKGRTFAIAAAQAAASLRDRDACRSGKRAAVQFQAAFAAARRAITASGAKSPEFQLVLRDLGGELLSVWTGPGAVPEVYVVGGDDALGPTFLRGGPEGFARIPVPGDGDLWWITNVPGSGMWTVGENGMAYRYDPATGALHDVATGVNGILYGVWGTAPDNVWAVGFGPPEARTVLLHWNGVAWSPFPYPPEIGGAALFKIDGRAADDIYACGSFGTLIHFDGTSWTKVESGTSRDLLTVDVGGATGSDAGGTAIAVGSVLSSEIVERGAGTGVPGTWAPITLPAGTRSVAGVDIPVKGDSWAVGYFATALRRVKGRWRAVEDVPFGAQDDVHLHAVRIDDAGGVWIAGGDIFAGGKGTLLYRGPRTIGPDAGTILPQARWTTDVHPLLYSSCAFTACHVKPLLGADLDMETPEAAAAALPLRPSVQSPLLRIAPGRPSRSYLWHKLNDTQADVGGFGLQMPQGEVLTPEQMKVIRAWILEGAPTGE